MTQTLPEAEGDPLKLAWQLGSKYYLEIVISYLRATEELMFQVDIPDGVYLSIGFGTDMVDVDMLTWFGLGADSVAKDHWSTAKKAPAEDSIADHNTRSMIFDETNNRVQFVTTRKLDTGDVDQDFLIPFDEELKMSWAIRYRSAEWLNHDLRDTFEMTLYESLGNSPDVLLPNINIDITPFDEIVEFVPVEEDV